MSDLIARLRARLTHTGHMKTSPAKINDLTTIADDAIAALERAEARVAALEEYIAADRAQAQSEHAWHAGKIDWPTFEAAIRRRQAAYAQLEVTDDE